MKNCWIIILLIVSGCVSSHGGLKIHFLGNCGFFYESHASKVLIDPFGSEFGDFFFLPSSELKAKMEKGQSPFENIDLLLITHNHGDHFNPFSAEKFLLNHGKSKMVCPPQVFNQMKDYCSHWDQIKPQIISPQLRMHQWKSLEIDGITLNIINLQHGTDRSLAGVPHEEYTEYEKTENYGYLMTLEEKVIFHQGDGCLKINASAIQNLQQEVDIAHLSYFDWDSVSWNFLNETLYAKYIIFMHGTKAGTELEEGDLASLTTDLVIFNHESESKTFD